LSGVPAERIDLGASALDGLRMVEQRHHARALAELVTRIGKVVIGIRFGERSGACEVLDRLLEQW
jgi:hypothetical protein